VLDHSFRVQRTAEIKTDRRHAAKDAQLGRGRNFSGQSLSS
jgi:hypothetical protein